MATTRKEMHTRIDEGAVTSKPPGWQQPLRASFARPQERANTRKRSDIVRVGHAQRVDVTLTEFSGVHQLRAAPTKDRSVLSVGQHVRHEPRMATIAIRRWLALLYNTPIFTIFSTGEPCEKDACQTG